MVSDFFLRHEKEGDGADDDNDDSDEDEHDDDGRQASEGSSCAPRTNFQGSRSSRDRHCWPPYILRPLQLLFGTNFATLCLIFHGKSPSSLAS